MGNEQSQEGDQSKNNKDIMMSIDTISIFKGTKTEGSEKQWKHTNSQTSTKTAEKNNAFLDRKIVYLFEWKEGGNCVLITGGFVNWQQNFTMIKNSNGVFVYPIEMNQGVYQFKFIVDNKWRCSQYYTTIKDEFNNINNIIDLTNYINDDQNQQSPEGGKSILQTRTQTQTYAPPLQQLNRKDYPSNMPSQSEMNTDCPQVPIHYQKMFNIDYNTNQNKIGDNVYLNYCERNLLSENNSYKKILVPSHVNLNHHCSKFISQDGSVKYCRIIKACVSQRIRHKFITVIYYNNSH